MGTKRKIGYASQVLGMLLVGGGLGAWVVGIFDPSVWDGVEVALVGVIAVCTGILLAIMGDVIVESTR